MIRRTRWVALLLLLVTFVEPHAEVGIDMNSQHFSKKRHITLGVSAGLDVARSLIVGIAAVTGRDIQVVIVT